MSAIPSISIVGAGNVAFHLGKAFSAAGIPVDRIWNRTFEKAAALARELGTRAAKEPEELAGSSLIICCASDSALPELIPQLSSIAPVATTSGTVDVLALEHQFPVGVFYPLQTFSGNRPADFSTIPLFIEGSDLHTTELLLSLGKRLSHTVIELPAAKRAELHIAAVFINNFTNHMVDLGQQFLEKHDLSFEWLKPLLNETIAKLGRQTAFEAQTGPARRNDTPTLEKHIAALDPEQAALYKLISNSIQQRYSRS